MFETFGVLFFFVRQGSGFVRGVNGYGAVMAVSARRLGLGRLVTPWDYSCDIFDTTASSFHFIDFF